MILTDAAVRHRTTVFVLMALVALAGAFAFAALPRESAPDIKIPYMNVITLYPGVAPGDVETLLTIPIENELKNLRDVEHVTSVSAEGASVITIQFKPDVDLDFALQRVKEKVDTAQQELPDEAEDPLVEEISTSDFPILQVNVTGDVGLVRLKQIAEDLQERIEGIRGVLRAQLVGGREREIRVEFDPARLAAYRLSPQEVAQTVKGANVNIPGGSLELGEANYLLRVPGEFADPAEISALVVARRESRAVYVRDVARVVDGFKEDETISRYNGVPSVSLSIQKRAGENIIRICGEVRRLLDEARARVPAGVQIGVSFDESRVISRMLTDLNNNMINGLLLVIGVLFFTMGLLSSVFVALAIPFSMLITLAVLQALGYTLNIIVLFSLVLVLGMLVDNAIVIVENIYRHQEEGEEPVQAALRGTAEVAWPVVASSATNIAPFVPMLFWPGIMGEFMSYLPKTVITGLLASLFVALVVNPTLCAAFMRVRPERRLAAGARAPSRFMRLYERLLAFSIDHHRASIAAVFAALAVLVALYGVFGKGLVFFPDIEPDRGSVNIEAPRGTSLATTDALARRAEEVARCCDDVDFVIADVGTGGRSVFVGGGSSRSDAARIAVNFREYEQRREKASATLARIREGALREIVGAEVEVAKEEHGPPTGAPVNVEVSGEDFETIVRLAARVTEEIKRIPGVVDLKDDYDPGQPEIRVHLDKERAALHGVSAAEVAGVIRAAVSGLEAGVLREGDEEYDITVRLPKAERRSLDTLSHMTIPDRLGNQVPLGTFARLEIGEGLGSIRRKDNKRVVTVSGEVHGRLADEVRREAQAAVAGIPLPPRTGIAFTGEYEEQEKNQAFLGKAFLVGVLLIALVLVTEFNSLRISFIILFTVVLSLMGVIVGLLVTGFPFGVIMTGIGVISLGGIVVNNAIVLLDFIEKLRAGGMPLREALITAGRIRLRPVTLGAISTVVGLIPVALGIDIDFVNLRVVFGSESSQWWESLAVAIIFGATVATALTLVMVPTFYRAFFGRAEARRAVLSALALAAAVTLPAASPAAAAAEPPPARTLAEVVAATLASEESLRIVEAEVRKAELRSRRYLLYLTPDVRAKGAWVRTGAEESDEPGAQGSGPESGDNWSWALSLTQPLYTGGRALAAYRGQKDLEASVRLQAELTGRDLALAAAAAYYDTLAAAESVRIGEQGMVLARRQLERAGRRVELGEAVLSDRLRAEVSLRRLEAELAGARSALARAREAVRRLSGLELAEDPVVPAQLAPIAGGDAELVAEALAARLEPRQLQLAVAAAEQDVREKKGRFLPSLALRAAWGEAGATVWEREWSWTAGIFLEVPIYQSGSTPLELREARESLGQERLRAGSAARDIEREVRSLLREIEAARSAVESLRLGVDAAAENLRLAERRYEVGLADSLEVADAQQADLVARVGLANAGFRLEALTLRLRNALGRELFERPGAGAAPR